MIDTNVERREKASGWNENGGGQCNKKENNNMKTNNNTLSY